MSSFPAPDRPKPSGTGGVILIVDDNADNREVLKRRLARLDFTCVEASDGREALDVLKRRAVDLVLLDVAMPGMSGLDVLKAIRAQASERQLPVIMVTADAQADSIALAKSLGANDYVTKPIDFRAAVASIETHLNLARASMQIADARRDLRLARQERCDPAISTPSATC